MEFIDLTASQLLIKVRVNKSIQKILVLGPKVNELEEKLRGTMLKLNIACKSLKFNTLL